MRLCLLSPLAAARWIIKKKKRNAAWVLTWIDLHRGTVAGAVPIPFLFVCCFFNAEQRSEGEVRRRNRRWLCSWLVYATHGLQKGKRKKNDLCISSCLFPIPVVPPVSRPEAQRERVMIIITVRDVVVLSLFLSFFFPFLFLPSRQHFFVYLLVSIMRCVHTCRFRPEWKEKKKLAYNTHDEC